MDFTVAAGLGGIGFVLVAVVVNVIYVRGGLPMPVAGKDLVFVPYFSVQQQRYNTYFLKA